MMTSTESEMDAWTSLSTQNTPLQFNEDVYARDTIVSDQIREIVEIVGSIVLCGTISVLGIVANSVNLYVFYRQGPLADCSTLTLFALAIADLGCLLTVLIVSVTAILTLMQSGSQIRVLYARILSSVIHTVFVHISSWITAFITFHRCVCVAFPFKARILFSVRNTVFSVVTIYGFITVSFTPMLLSNQLKYVYYRNKKSTVLAIVTDFEMFKISALIHRVAIRAIVLLFVFICNKIIIYKVKLSKSWRESMAVESGSEWKRNVKPINNKIGTETGEAVLNTGTTQATSKEIPEPTPTTTPVPGETSSTAESTSTASSVIKKTRLTEPQIATTAAPQTMTTTSIASISLTISKKATSEPSPKILTSTETAAGTAKPINPETDTTLKSLQASELSKAIKGKQMTQSQGTETLTTTRPSSSSSPLAVAATAVEEPAPPVKSITSTSTQHPRTPRTKRSNDSKSTRSQDGRLIMMISISSAVFLICNFPDLLVRVVLIGNPYFKNIPPTDNLFPILIAFQFLLESINSSVNIIVYYKMSTKYRQTLHKLMGIRDVQM